MIPLAKPIVTREMVEAAIYALQNERFVLGESVYKFEEEFARYCGAKYAVSTSSGTNALQLALLALDVKWRDEVVTTPASFIATANVAIHVGAIPIFADIDLKTYTIDPLEVEKSFSEKSKVVIPVHLYGYPADMDKIIEVSEMRGIFVVEDASQAHGAIYKGSKVGTIGDVGCFSFYPSKCMTVCGDGGMVVTNNGEVAEKVIKLRDCGRSHKYIHDMIGYTARLNTINAAIGRVQLRYLDKWNEARRKNARLYDKLLSHISEVTLPCCGESDIKPVYSLYVIRTKYRDKLKRWLEGNGVECGLHYELPIHLQPIYRKLYRYKGGEYPRSEKLCRTCLSIPLYPELKKDDIMYVYEKIYEFFDKKLYERIKC